MAACNGPRLNTTNLLYTQQPGVTTRHMTTGGTIISHATGVTVSTYKSVLGAQRSDDRSYGISNPVENVSTQIIDQLSDTIYVCPDGNTITIGNTYSISAWIKIKNFGTQDHLGYSLHAKRGSLIRFNYRDKGAGNTRDGFIEFGALGPYYRNIGASTNAYKFVFEPFSLGACIRTSDRTNSICTDFIYYFDTWYLITLELSGYSDLSSISYTNTYAKLYVNGELKSCAPYRGNPWAIGTRAGASNIYHPRRANPNVISQPGFINTISNTSIGHSTTNLWQHGKWLSLDKLNYISFSPISRINHPTANGSTPGANDGSQIPLIKRKRKNTQTLGSWIEFGQFYIYNKEFDINIYNNFKYLYT